jgi:hypothetical protein
MQVWWDVMLCCWTNRIVVSSFSGSGNPRSLFILLGLLVPEDESTMILQHMGIQHHISENLNLQQHCCEI